MLKYTIAVFISLSFLCGTYAAENPKKTDKPRESKNWIPLFDGKSLDGWIPMDFAGAGEVNFSDKAIVIGTGVDVSGIRLQESTLKKPFPKINYEIRYEARRKTGYDFFGAITFPVGDTHCTFVNGGWGGGTIGLSCIDHYDASDNATSAYYRFDKDCWYEIRVRVYDGKITVWIKEIPTEAKLEKAKKAKERRIELEKEAEKEGKKLPPLPAAPNPDEPVVNFIYLGHKISLRNESDDFKPLGFATWRTEGLIRKIEYRELADDEMVELKKEVDDYRKRFIDKD